MAEVSPAVDECPQRGSISESETEAEMTRMTLDGLQWADSSLIAVHFSKSLTAIRCAAHPHFVDNGINTAPCMPLWRHHTAHSVPHLGQNLLLLVLYCPASPRPKSESVRVPSAGIRSALYIIQDTTVPSLGFPGMPPLIYHQPIMIWSVCTRQEPPCQPGHRHSSHDSCFRRVILPFNLPALSSSIIQKCMPDAKMHYTRQ